MNTQTKTATKVDLNQCKKGDILITSQGIEVEYVSKTPWRNYTYLDHVIKYLDPIYGESNYGTRTNDGFVFQSNRIPETDNDIVEIIFKNK